MGLFALPVTAILLLAMSFGPNASRVDYVEGVIAKHKRLDALSSPKVMVIGGSNATFGIDSELLETGLCKPAVNMSIHASLGFRFMVDEVKGSIGEGDLVIAALEHSSYSHPAKDNDLHILLVDRWPEAIRFTPWYTRPRVIMGVMVMRAQGAWKIFTGAWKDDSQHQVYRASGFNERGDLVSHLGLPPWGPARQQSVGYSEPVIDDAFWPIAMELADSVRAHHAQLVFVWPVVANTSYRPQVCKVIEEGLVEHGLTMVGSTEDYTMPDSSFHDTHYHLRSAGRQLRTARLVRDLCATKGMACCAPKKDTP